MNRPSRCRIYIRYLSFLLWEFRWSLGIFWGMVFLGGLIVDRTEPDLNYLEACHGVFLLIFLEMSLEFPDEGYLQPFFFAVPIIGLGAVADSLVRLAYLTFTHKQRLPEWQRMVASLYKNHIVVVGVGKVGLQLIKELSDLGEATVAVELEKETPFLDEVHDLGVPVITGDGRQQKTLEHAGLANAKSIVAVTDDDLTNLDSALTAQNIKPDVKVVLRLYDETLGQKVRAAFDMPAISIAHVSAPSFVAAATGKHVHPLLTVGNQELQVTDLRVRAGSKVDGVTVGELERDYGVNVVLLNGANGTQVNPESGSAIPSGATVHVIAPPARIHDLLGANTGEAHSSRSSS